MSREGSAVIATRVPRPVRHLVEAAAQQQGETMSSWMRSRLQRAAARELTEEDRPEDRDRKAVPA